LIHGLKWSVGCTLNLTINGHGGNRILRSNHDSTTIASDPDSHDVSSYSDDSDVGLNPTIDESDDELPGDKDDIASATKIYHGDVILVHDKRQWICKTCVSRYVLAGKLDLTTFNPEHEHDKECCICSENHGY
jgi:hypothetical protein